MGALTGTRSSTQQIPEQQARAHVDAESVHCSVTLLAYPNKQISSDLARIMASRATFEILALCLSRASTPRCTGWQQPDQPCRGPGRAHQWYDPPNRP